MLSSGLVLYSKGEAEEESLAYIWKSQGCQWKGMDKRRGLCTPCAITAATGAFVGVEVNSAECLSEQPGAQLCSQVIYGIFAFPGQPASSCL